MASCLQALFFWHVNNSTKECKFLADNALLFLHLQVNDFIIYTLTVWRDSSRYAITLLCSRRLRRGERGAPWDQTR